MCGINFFKQYNLSLLEQNENNIASRNSYISKFGVCNLQFF